DSVDEVPEFLRNVTNGRPVPVQVIEEVKHRYSSIGCSPLTALTLKQGELLSRELGTPVYVGMRNCKPYIADIVASMEAAQVSRAVVICLAPQKSQTSGSSLLRARECPVARGLALRSKIRFWNSGRRAIAGYLFSQSGSYATTLRFCTTLISASGSLRKNKACGSGAPSR